MNYLSQLQAFDTWLETNELSSAAISLWFALMQTANRSGWKSPFCVAMSVLEHKSGVERRSLYRARNTLKQAGLIDFKERGSNRASEYKITVLYGDGVTHTVTQGVTHTVTQTVTHPVTHSVTITKLNKTKDIEKREEEKRAAFVKPSLTAIKAYGETLGHPECAEAFFDHFESNGWKVGGRSKMVDWKAAYRAWVQRQREFEKSRAGGAKEKKMGIHAGYQQTELTDDQLDALLMDLSSDDCLEGYK